MKNLIYFISFLLVLNILSTPIAAQKSIRAIEFWTDGNSQMRTQQYLTSGAIYNWEELVTVTSLSDGVHTFNARFCNSDGVWTNVQSHFFLKQTNSAGVGVVKKIAALEYWINGDAATRTQRTLTAQNPYNWDELLDYSTIPDGVNTFNARFKDEFGAWTSVQSHFFIKQTNTTGVGIVKKIITLEYWINGDAATRTQRTLNAQNPYNWDELLDFSTIPDGVNTFNARFKDEFGAWTSVQSHFFIKQTNTTGVGIVKKITALEYWINGDAATRTQRTLNAQNPYNWEELLDYSTIPDGVNTFNARFKDEFGAWTSVQSHFFIKQTNTTGVGVVKKIKALEYWINGDAATRTQRTLTAQNPYNWDELLDYSTIPDGVNTFNARFKDEFGAWTSVQSHFFIKQTNTTGVGVVKKITALEYWTNGDATTRTQRTLTAQNTYNWEELLDYSTIPDVVNTFNARFKDEFGAWTSVQSHFFIKQTKGTGENKIVGYRLWYAQEPTFIDNLSIASPANNVDINDSVSVTYLPKGSHLISYQLRDMQGVWSPVITDTISKSDNALFSFVADKREIMQNESVKLTPNIRHFIDSIVWSFGDGMTEVNFEPVHKYDSNGQFDVKATVWHKGSREGIVFMEIKYISVLSTGLSAPNVLTLKLYPIPVKNELTIEISTVQMVSIQIVSTNGTVLKTEKPTLPNKTTLSVSDLTPGSYIVVVRTDKGVITAKFVKD